MCRAELRRETGAQVNVAAGSCAPTVKGCKMVFTYNLSSDLQPEPSSDWPAEIRLHTECQNWTLEMQS